MSYEKQKFNGMLMNGDLKKALEYLEEFPEKKAQAKSISNRFDTIPIRRCRNEYIQEVDSIFQHYYKMIFWDMTSREEGTDYIEEKLREFVTNDVLKSKFDEMFKEEAEEQFKEQDMRIFCMEEIIKEKACDLGYNYLGGKTQGYYGPYIWKKTRRDDYLVELPVGEENFTVYMMEEFISRSWLDFISLGKIGAGGWQNEKGIFCVWNSYKKKINKPGFQCSFLKHEAQHAFDKRTYPEITSLMLEYRAKLVELIYYPNLSRLRFFFIGSKR